MSTHKRYRLTEAQLKPVIRYIDENYPAGINDFNFDELSGANRHSYERIQDVTLEPDGKLLVSIETDKGASVEKEVWMGDDKVINVIQQLLPKYGYDIKQFPEWEVINASYRTGFVVLDVIGDGKSHQISVSENDVIKWLPEISDYDVADREEDPDRERGGW